MIIFFKSSSKVIDQDGLDFESLPSLNTKEDFNQISNFFASTMREISDNELDLLNSFDTNTQLMSIPLNTSYSADAYLNLDDNSSVDTNVLYSDNYSTNVNPVITH